MNHIYTIKKRHQDELSEIFKKHGVFFAFSTQQFNEAKKEGVKYARTLAGGFVPVDNSKAFISDFKKYSTRCDDELSKPENRKAYILYTLSNYECWYSWDLEPAIETLKSAGISAEEVRKTFIENKEEYQKDL